MTSALESASSSSSSVERGAFMSNMLPSHVVGGGAEKSGDDLARLAADVAALGARAADHFFIINQDRHVWRQDGAAAERHAHGDPRRRRDADGLAVARGLATRTTLAGAREVTIPEFVAIGEKGSWSSRTSGNDAWYAANLPW